MLDRKLRKQIEWHFKNYKADLLLCEEMERDIIDSGLTANFGRIGSSYQIVSPTESKALRIEILDHKHNWTTVVRNTFNYFRFEPEYDIMVALYIDCKHYRELCLNGLWESTLYRWREKWLEHAYKWAKELNLI